MIKNLPASKKFSAGTVFVDFKKTIKNNSQKYNKIVIKYPSRLEAISLDPSKIAESSRDNIYTAGQIDFCVGVFKIISISTNKTGKINISQNTNRKSLVLHSALLMKRALETKIGFDIEVVSDRELRHCGLGSSSSIIQGVAAAINELFGNPIESLDLIHYMISNHGEEVDGSDEDLIQVQSVGGSGICGHFVGGIIVNAGRAVPIFRSNLPKKYKVVIGIPKSFSHPDSSELMNEELKNISGFKNTGKEFGGLVACRLINEAIPGIIQKDYKPCKDLIFDYRWNMGSIKNCSFVCPEIITIAEKMRPLKNDKDIVFLSLSSVGPGFFMITEKPKKAKLIFESLNMSTFTTNICNDKYKILERSL